MADNNTTDIGTHIPQAERKAMNKKMMINTIEMLMNKMSSLCIRET